MSYQVRVTQGAEIVVPAASIHAFGLLPGDALDIDRDGSAIVVRTYADTIREGQDAFQTTITRPFTVDDFIADRRDDAMRG